MADDVPVANEDYRPISGSESLPSFTDFVRAKAEEFGIGDRHRRRDEWVGALERLLVTIRDHLERSDPDKFIDFVPYQLTRTEPMLGTYDAPALKIRLGAVEADVVPIGRGPTRSSDLLKRTRREDAGRVEIRGSAMTSQHLFRLADGPADRWEFRYRSKDPVPLDQAGIERAFVDLWS